MTLGNKYFEIDTLTIRTGDEKRSSEFINLSDKNVIGKLPIDKGFAVFRLNTDSNIELGKFIRQDDEFYDGEFNVISSHIKFEEEENFFVENGFYDPDETFYIFYNREDNIYLRVFLTRQGFFGDEILVLEKYKLKRLERIKENFFMVVEELKVKEIYEKIDALGDGEIRIAFLYENDIDKFVGKLDLLLNVQLANIPFNDINEKSWTCENKVEQERGFMFIENMNTTNVYHEESINGCVFKDPGKIIVQLNPETDDYTITMRYKPVSDAPELSDDIPNAINLMESENFKIDYNNFHYTMITTDNQFISSGPVDIDDKTFFNISIAQQVFPENDTYKIAMYIDDQLEIEHIITPIPEDFKRDTMLTINNVELIDYLAQQNTALHRDVIFDLHLALDRRLIIDYHKRKIRFDWKDLKGFIETCPDCHDIPLLPALNPIYDFDSECFRSLEPIFPPELFVDNLNETITARVSLPEEPTQALMFTKDIFTVLEANEQAFGGYTDWREATSSELVATSGLFLSGHAARDIDSELELRFTDSYNASVCTITGGSESTIEHEGIPVLRRVTLYPEYKDYSAEYTWKERRVETNPLYTRHYKLNSASRFVFNTNIPLCRRSKNDDLQNTVIPLFLEEAIRIPNVIFPDPRKQVRISEAPNGIFDSVPFIVEENADIVGMTLWVPGFRFRNQVPVQFGLKEENKKLNIKPTYSKYEALSNQLYNQNAYFFAYHFDRLIDQRRILIKDVSLHVTGEIVLGGVTDNNSYMREISMIRFYDNPERFKVPEFRIELDVKDIKDRTSYINNADELKKFVRTLVELWKPSTDSINDIIERKTLILAKLLKDEFTQIIVGLTARNNVNAYYIRSIETGQVNLLTSSTKLDEEVDFLGVGRIDTPYVKSGVTKIKQPGKNMKIFFETSFPHSEYRIFVFAPINAFYFVPIRDKNGFIVESSALVEQEVAWIAINTLQIRNGLVDWKQGIPTGQSLVENTSRALEVNVNSTKYVVDFVDLGYPVMPNTDFSVILTPDKNVNLWVENKTTRSFTIKRSYAGENIKISWMLIQSNTKWWETITG